MSELLVFIIPLGIGLFFISVSVFQFLWNITIPEVLGLKTITYWQAFRLLIIAAFLFGGPGLLHFRFNT